MAKSAASRKITTSSTAEYFSKNLQQVGFSSPTKAVLTTIKEAVDNSLDACEDNEILPEIRVTVEKLGNGHLKNTDKLLIRVEDNGPGIAQEDIAKVFGEYLASSKFGRGRCSRGQQGIGISAATTWALQTTATPVKVITKTTSQRKASACQVEVDLKNNKGILKDKNQIDWDRPSGTSVEFVIDGRVQLNGEAGLLNYLRSSILVNPHLTLHYALPEVSPSTYERVTKDLPAIPDATEPHPHTMKLGEFLAHARLFGKTKMGTWLKTGFSRLSDKVLQEICAAHNMKPAILNQGLDQVSEDQFRGLYEAIQKSPLMAPSTQSVLSVGEEALSLSMERLGEVDFFSVVTRKPTICDFKPVQIEVAVGRLKGSADPDEPVQVLRFANRVPLQFDKASCAVVKAINTVNWKVYGLRQPKDSLPTGPYIIAVSVVSPFIKFKNASKETIDASDELVEEIRRTLMQAGQRLSRHLSRENKAAELQERRQHLEQFGPILVETICRILEAPDSRKVKAEEGLKKLLDRDAKQVAVELKDAEEKLDEHLLKKRSRLASFRDEDASLAPPPPPEGEETEGEESVISTEEGSSEETSTGAKEKGGKKGKKKNKEEAAAEKTDAKEKPAKEKASKEKPGKEKLAKEKTTKSKAEKPTAKKTKGKGK